MSSSPGRCAAGAPIALLVPLLSGCLGGPAAPRFFEPAIPPSAASPATVGPIVLRLRKVEAPGNLKDRIQWRRGDVETGFYDDERWATEPAYLLWSELRRELYERRGLRSGGPRAPFVLDVDLAAFEELLLPEHRVRVKISAVLATREETALRVQTYEALLPVGAENAEAMARAMGAALREVLDALATDVVTSLRAAESEESK